MLYDLLFWNKLHGLTKAQVTELLGRPDGPYGLPDVLNQYSLGRTSYTYMTVFYDKTGRAEHVSVVVGSNS